MKKRALPFILIGAVTMCQPVMAMDQDNTPNIVTSDETAAPFASDYIGAYSCKLEHIKDGTLKLTGNLNALNTDKIEIKAQLQSNSNGTWENCGSATRKTSSTPTVTLINEKNVSSGTYRAKFTYNAYIGDEVVETRTLTSSTVTVRL